MMSNFCLVLKPPQDEERLFTQLEECLQPWHERYDLFLLHDETLEDESGVTTAIWRDAARQEFEVRLVFDDAVPMIYVCIVPDDRTDVATLLGELAQRFAVYKPDELRAPALSNPADMAAWTRLAISLNGAHDGEIESAMQKQLSSDDADQLAAAAMAASLLRWRELVDPLRAALARPIPESVRPALALALQACQT